MYFWKDVKRFLTYLLWFLIYTNNKPTKHLFYEIKTY